MWHFAKFELLVTSGDLNIAWAKNDWNTSGGLNIDLSEKQTGILSKVLIESNQTLFPAPDYPS